MLWKKYKHIIWDWNGTIFNDVQLCVDVGNNLFMRKNISPISMEKYKSIFTIPVKDYYITAGFDFSVESFEIIGKEWMDEYEERKYECTIYENLLSVMQKFKEIGVEQSVVSAYKQDRLSEMIKRFELDQYLNHVIGLDNIYAAGKLHLAQKLIDLLDNGHGETLMIGDTIHDFEVAQKTGSECILIADGHQSKEKLLSTGVKVYDTIQQFYEKELTK